jgi:hypothetical protein
VKVCRHAVGLLFAVAATVAFVPSPAGAAGQPESCAHRVIRDWYVDGTIDNSYSLGCYRAALRALPEDIRQYSSADEDIRDAITLDRARAPARVIESARHSGAQPPPDATTGLSSFSIPVPVLLLGTLAFLLLSVGGAGVIARRRR